MKKTIGLIACAALLTMAAAADQKPRARDIGIKPGILAPGTWNAITDVRGVKVGHVTIREGVSINTGVTVIIPGDGNQKVNAVDVFLPEKASICSIPVDNDHPP